ERRSLLDARSRLRQPRHHLSGHGRNQTALGSLAFTAVRERIDARKLIAAPVQEDVPLFAGDDHGCVEPQAAELHPQRGVRTEFAMRRHGDAVEPELIPSPRITDDDRALSLAVAKDQLALEARVQPPAVVE